MDGYKSKVDIVYDNLFEDIINGNYNPGDRMIISKIAKESKVSEIPVREAIRRLESEGYVKINANQGAIVSEMDVDMITQIFQIKGVLEGFASRMSIDYLRGEDFEKLKSINRNILQAFNDNEIDRYSELNIEFHLTIYKCIPQREMYNMIVDLWKKWGMTRKVFNIVPTRAGESYDEHEIIIKMLEDKEYDNVETFVRQHKFKAGQQFVSHAKLIADE